MEWEAHYNDERYDYRVRRASSRAGLRLHTLPRVAETTGMVTRYDPDGPRADEGPLVDVECSYDRSGNYRPGEWTGRCSCGREAVDTERQWELAPSVDPDPDDTIPGYRYTGAEWHEPVCYPVTVDRYERAPYSQHWLTTAAPADAGRLLDTWGTTRSELTEIAAAEIADWIARGRPSAKEGGRLRSRTS